MCLVMVFSVEDEKQATVLCRFRQLFFFSNRFLFYSFSNGSVGVDFIVTFNDTTGVNDINLQQEFLNALNITNNGTFLMDSHLQVTNETDPTFQGS
jgi:hypothetical protein